MCLVSVSKPLSLDFETDVKFNGLCQIWASIAHICFISSQFLEISIFYWSVKNSSSLVELCSGTHDVLMKFCLHKLKFHLWHSPPTVKSPNAPPHFFIFCLKNAQSVRICQVLCNLLDLSQRSGHRHILQSSQTGIEQFHM